MSMERRSIWVLLAIGMLCTSWGCAPSPTVRRAKLEQYPKIPAKVAASMMRGALAEFLHSMRATPRCSPQAYAGKWQKLLRGVRPLVRSLRSYELGQLKKKVRPHKRTRRYWSLPRGLRQGMADVEWVASRKIKSARLAAMWSKKQAVAELEASLEERDGVSKKALRAPKPPKRRVRRASKRRYGSLGLVYPVPGRRIGSDYGWRKSPMSRRWRFHTGVDIGARRGTPILGAASGVVIRARYMGSCGRGVIIRHRIPGYKRVTTTYCHMSKILVRRKQRIKAGQVIGRIGSTGNSTGPHLHFAVHINRRHVHPRNHFRR